MEYEALLREVEEERVKSSYHDSNNDTNQNADDMERDEVVENNDSEEDEEEEDDIELDPMELEAYKTLQKANEMIKKMETTEPNKTASLILPSRELVYDDEALKKKIEEIKISDKQSWVEHLSLNSTVALKINNFEDDYERESAFFQQALETAVKGFQNLRSLGINPERPDDYFAEMVKSDEHMAKIKEKILGMKKVKEMKEHAAQQRQLKKFGKRVQAEKLREKIEQKKANLKVLQHWRKKKKDNDTKEFNMEDFEKEVEKMKNESLKQQKHKETMNDIKTGKSSSSSKKKRIGKSQRMKNSLHRKGRT